jgi:hypothetical protein
MAQYHFVSHLPDLIQPEEYADDPGGRRVRLRIRATADGVEVLGDAVRPAALEQLLEELGAAVIEQMLCG